MREAAGNLSSFPIARCEACGKTVLLYLAFGADGQEQRLCIQCDSLIELQIEGPVDLAHAAATQLLNDLVLGDLLADHVPDGSAFVGGGILLVAFVPGYCRCNHLQC